jgi:hypothetical protein
MSVPLLMSAGRAELGAAPAMTIRMGIYVRK